MTEDHALWARRFNGEVITMENDNGNEKKAAPKKPETHSDECCFYIMDPSGEYYFSNGCCKEPIRHCLR